MARAAAGGKDVAVAGGGTLLRQVLEAGLLDELELHIAPGPARRQGSDCSTADLGSATARASS